MFSHDQKGKSEYLNHDHFGDEHKPHTVNHRLLGKDGAFNIVVEGQPWFRPTDTYQSLITMSWPKFILMVFSTYIVVNTLFAAIYYVIGTEHLTNTSTGSEWGKFLDAFFFSSQSITTVGYGRVAPTGILASIVAAVESMIGLLGFALATGLLYGRFSRPNARLLNSRNALISPHKGGNALMFRIANERKSQLVDVDVQVTYKRAALENGKPVRLFTPLKLENHRLNMFPLTWTLIHELNKESPLYGKTIDDFIEEDMELLVYFKGYDETFSNNVHCRLSYKPSEIVVGARFIRNFEDQDAGHTIHYLNRISNYEEVPLNPE